MENLIELTEVEKSEVSGGLRGYNIYPVARFLADCIEAGWNAGAWFESTYMN